MMAFPQRDLQGNSTQVPLAKTLSSLQNNPVRESVAQVLFFHIGSSVGLR
jgi:hypothetical protein